MGMSDSGTNQDLSSELSTQMKASIMSLLSRYKQVITVWNGAVCARTRSVLPTNSTNQSKKNKFMGSWMNKYLTRTFTLELTKSKITTINKAQSLWTRERGLTFAIRLTIRERVKLCRRNRRLNFGRQRGVSWVSCRRRLMWWKKIRRDRG